MHETLRGFTCLRGDRQGGEGAGNYTTYQDGKELLTDPMRGMAMKLFDMLEGFLIAVVVFHGPAAPVQGDERAVGETAWVNEVRQ
jgi:hypothetical protein